MAFESLDGILLRNKFITTLIVDAAKGPEPMSQAAFWEKPVNKPGAFDEKSYLLVELLRQPHTFQKPQEAFRSIARDFDFARFFNMSPALEGLARTMDELHPTKDVLATKRMVIDALDKAQQGMHAHIGG